MPTAGERGQAITEDCHWTQKPTVVAKYARTEIRKAFSQWRIGKQLERPSSRIQKCTKKARLFVQYTAQTKYGLWHRMNVRKKRNLLRDTGEGSKGLIWHDVEIIADHAVPRASPGLSTRGLIQRSENQPPSPVVRVNIYPHQWWAKLQLLRYKVT